MATCKLCGQRPTVVPDRETMSRRKTVCRECHGKRLLGDLEVVKAEHVRRLRRVQEIERRNQDER